MKKLAFSIAVAAGLASLLSFTLYRQRLEEELAGGTPTPVLVATRDVAIGETLSENMLGVRELPAGYLEERHILSADADKVLGVRVTSGLKANESVLWTDLAASGFERRDLSGLVQNGMRAITISVGRGSTLGGLLRPGDRIDLLMTAQKAREGAATVPLLQNLLVLAVGRDTGTSLQSKNPVTTWQAPQITLSVTAAQAQAITHARAAGLLTVSLRNPDDIVVLEDMPATTDRDLHEDLAELQKRRPFGLSLRLQEAAEPDQEIEHVR